MKPELRIFSSLAALYGYASEKIFSAAYTAIRDHGYCSLVLSGGKTPLGLYERFVSETQRSFPWNRVHLFWGDERHVPYDSPDSNYGTAKKVLSRCSHIPESSMHPIPFDPSGAERSAVRYERELREFFTAYGKLHAGFPPYDVVLLGLGSDGHTASLFPGDVVSLSETKRWVVPVWAESADPQGWRVSLTLPVLNNARHTYFIVAGTKKKSVMESILNSSFDAHSKYPAARIRPCGTLKWLYTDETP